MKRFTAKQIEAVLTAILISLAAFTIPNAAMHLPEWRIER